MRTYHAVPVEDFQHEIDHAGECVCGPECRMAGSVSFFHHWALDSRFYRQPLEPRTKGHALT